MDLARAFHQVEAALEGERARLNQMDENNHNHGDNMVAIFHCASQAAAAGDELPQAMTQAAIELRKLVDNGSAQVYARGLGCLADQLRQRQIGLQDLLLSVRGYLSEAAEDEAESMAKGAALRSSVLGAVITSDGGKQGEATKALLNALSAWERAENAAMEPQQPGNAGPGVVSDKRGMDLGYLFGLGMAYLQAKQKGGDRLEVLAETVVSASPLDRVPYRHASGVLAVRSLLSAMRSGL
jgi:hypothetical protein